MPRVLLDLLREQVRVGLAEGGEFVLGESLVGGLVQKKVFDLDAYEQGNRKDEDGKDDQAQNTQYKRADGK